MKTFSAKPLEVERAWWLIDADGQTLGRLATEIALILRGKRKAQFTPNIDTGDFVVVINADKIRVTGKKPTQKYYRRHSGFPGGFRQVQYKDMFAAHPERVLEIAVRGMLPHTTLGRQQLRKLNIYAGSQHPHAAQQPVPYPHLEVAR
ncbi:MAG: 50S ribosomal protein L13 [Vampirovibrionales bacterium]|nr:50S ribosomal protein L13 [Vampirovibrionales bacterium]